MKTFTTHTGIVATLNRANVDTDAIIPKQFLKSIKRTGYGPNAFFDWRYTASGESDTEFELNQPRFEGRSILVTRNNFGCGSSREHAVWALVQDGYRVIIAPWKETGGQHLPAFADIFRINAAKNGLLVIELSENEVDAIFKLVDEHTGLQTAVDLEKQHDFTFDKLDLADDAFLVDDTGHYLVKTDSQVGNSHPLHNVLANGVV